MLDRRRTLIVCGVSLLLPIALAGSLVIRTGDVSVLNYFGYEGPSSDFIRQHYPRALFLDPVGHDGSAYYVISRTFPNMHEASANLDNPTYRLRRILVPAILRPFAGRTYTVVLFLLTLAAVAVGAFALSTLLVRAGFPWWLGISFGLSPGVLYAARFGLVDVIAIALALLGLMVIERRPLVGVMALTGAGLTRETSVVAAVAAVLAFPKVRRYALIPIAITIGWVFWVSQSFPQGPLDLIARPFAVWFSHGLWPGLLAATMFAVSLAGAWSLRLAAPALAWLLVGDAALLSVVASSAFFGGNFLRVAPLALTALMTLVSSHGLRVQVPSEALS